MILLLKICNWDYKLWHIGNVENIHLLVFKYAFVFPQTYFLGSNLYEIIN